MDIQLGFSTGVFYKQKLTLRERIAIIRSIGCHAIELGCVKMETFDSGEIEALNSFDLTGFNYVSLHAPTFNYGGPGTERILEKVARLHANLSFTVVIVHPDTITNIDVFKNCGFPVALENMDNRKTSCQTPDELLALLSKNDDLSFVLDVNHVYSNDKSMKLADEFYERLGDRISEIHLSGYAGYHEPLYETQQTEILEHVRTVNTPIIVEGILTPETIAKEQKYILEALCEP